MVREFVKERGKSQNSDRLSERKVLPLLKSNPIAVSAKILQQEVIENSLGSGRSQVKVRGNEIKKRGHPMSLLWLHQKA